MLYIPGFFWLKKKTLGRGLGLVQEGTLGVGSREEIHLKHWCVSNSPGELTGNAEPWALPPGIQILDGGPERCFTESTVGDLRTMAPGSFFGSSG